MNIVFTPTAWEQYTEWQREDKKMVKRINELIKDMDLSDVRISFREIMMCMLHLHLSESLT